MSKAIGCCTAGSPANNVTCQFALPSGNVIAAAASSGVGGPSSPGCELTICGNSSAAAGDASEWNNHQEHRVAQRRADVVILIRERVRLQCMSIYEPDFRSFQFHLRP